MDNVSLLLEAGADIYAYDPVGESNFKRLFPEGSCRKGSISYVATPKEALCDANICFIFTEWNEIREIKPLQYKKWMKLSLVYDGRNIYSPQDMAEADVEYYSSGR